MEHKKSTEKKLQKAFNISCESAKFYIDHIVEDIAKVNNISGSFVIEKILLDALLPSNEIIRSIVINEYAKDTFIKQTLTSIFDYNSMGKGINAKHNNLLPLVDYCMKNSQNAPLPKKRKPATQAYTHYFKAIVDVIELHAKEITDNDIDKKAYKQHSEWSKALYSDISKGIYERCLYLSFALIRDCWSLLSDWSITYKFLSEIVLLSTFNDNIAAKNELIDILKDISEEWETEKESEQGEH